MKKIPTLFVRDEQDRKHVIPGEVTPGCEWVLAGEGTPTRKFDGTCTMLDAEGRWWARREVKAGKPAPDDFVAEQHNEVTGKTQGWVPMESSAFARWHAEAVANAVVDDPMDFLPGTYELCGPKINGNPDRLDDHRLIRHGKATLAASLDLTPPTLIAGCRAFGYEGVVWHHPDGRMAKLKVRDWPWEQTAASTPEPGHDPAHEGSDDE